MTPRSIILAFMLTAATMLTFGACSAEPGIDSAETENVGEAEEAVGVGQACGIAPTKPHCDATLNCCDIVGGWGTCSNPLNDPNNCGACGTVCGAGKTCIASACVCATDAGCSGATPYCDSAHACVACIYHDDCPAGQLCRGTPDGAGDKSHGGFCSAEPVTPIYCTTDGDCPYEFAGDSDPAYNPTNENKIHCCGTAGAKKCMATAHDPKFCASSGGTCGTDLTTDPNKDTCYSKMISGVWTTGSCKAGVDCPAFSAGHYDRHE
jgi:hypothetical protein